MKNLITILIIAAVFSLNIFSQQNTQGFRVNAKSKQDLSKIVQGVTQYTDQTSNKISPLLNIFLNKITLEGGVKVKLPESFSTFKKVIYFYQNELNDLKVPIFVRTNSVTSAINIITTYNGKIETVTGDIITADVPVTSVKEIALSPEIIYVDASTISELKIDVSRLEAKVDLLHNGSGISRPYKGNGVVVGVLDSGIDWTHSDFKNTGGSRIKYLWDMSGSSNPPSGYDYGTEYTKAQLDANQCQEIDADDGHGHGTHVSGTAAGNGSALSNYIGMAPESDIVFVKGFRNSPGFANTDVVNGCNYIFQKAQQFGKPSVINLSLGGHFGPHDGTTLYEQALSNLTGNGKIIVAAAGNEGSSTIHLSYSAAGSSYNDAFETFFELFDGTPILLADMWYTGGNISVGLAAYNPSDGSLIGYTNGIPPGQKIEDVAFTVNSTTYGYITIDATGVNNPNNNSNEVLVLIDGHNGQVNIGNVWWSLYTFGSGTFDAWAVSGGIFSTYSGQSWFKPGDSEKTIGSPGSSSKVICVGSYVTKDHWVDINGVTQYQPGNPTIGAISSFSSIGPTRDGRLKPDFVAPGEVIVAAYSSFLTQTPPENILLGGKYQKMQGTSMASPHVTGVVALMLEKNGSLNYDQTVTILKNTTKKDSYTGTSPNNIYGNGKLDAYNAFVNTSGGGGTQITVLQEAFEGSFLPSGWTQQITNTNKTWVQGNVTDHNFNQIDPTSQYSAICPWVAENQDEWLITPPFTLGNGSASIEFYVGYSTQWLSAATIKLHISTNGGVNWTQLWIAENDGQDWSWRNRIIDITAYANKQNLKLAWQYVGNDGDIVAVDAIKLLGGATDVDDENILVTDYVLYQNYPNPFNPATMIEYSVPKISKTTLKIYDILGSEITTLVNEEKRAGVYKIDWNASKLSSGIYFYQLKSGDFIQTRKMLLLK
jgi:minor extracellular serine protease Vpr